MRGKKILLVANTDWYLYNFRLSLGKYLRDQGYEVIFVSPRGNYVDDIIANGFRFLEWEVGRRSILIYKEIWSIFKIWKIYKSEIPVLVHHFTIKPVLYGSIAARFSKVKGVINSITGLGYLFLSKDWMGKILKLIVFPLYRFSLSGGHVHNIFENIYDQQTFLIQKFTDLEKSSIINGVGVDEDTFSLTPDPETEIPLIVLPARMLYDKGVKTLVEASTILKRNMKLKIALVGELDPGNPSYIDENTIKKWENEFGVEWWGFNKNMQEVYKNCNIVTLPSLGEGLPTVLIEAAACGRPIVTTDVAGCRDVVQDGVNGFLVPPNNPEELANAIYKLIENPALRIKMGLEGRRIVLEKFTSKLINKKTNQIYQKLLNE